LNQVEALISSGKRGIFPESESAFPFDQRHYGEGEVAKMKRWREGETIAEEVI
jgi:hypothetical protein